MTVRKLKGAEGTPNAGKTSYRAVCKQGHSRWAGPIRKDEWDARIDYAKHLREKH